MLSWLLSDKEKCDLTGPLILQTGGSSIQDNYVSDGSNVII